MPNISVLKTSNFIKKEDCDPPRLVTIADVREENVAKEGAPEDMKWCLHFKEMDKPMVLNSTNGQIIAKITGSAETEQWTGCKVVIYHDPSVSFGGKLVGGIRCRAPRVAAPQTPAAAPRPAAAGPVGDTLADAAVDDDVPF